MQGTGTLYDKAKPLIFNEEKEKVVKVQNSQLTERLEVPKLCPEERLGIASQLREAFGRLNERQSNKEYTSVDQNHCLISKQPGAVD